jgi:predicted dehydrogenase
VACADIKKENAEVFANKFSVPSTYLDYREMLAKEKIDLLSICTWPHLHTEMVIAGAVAGVKAILCEKPMSDNWGDARLMAQECERRGVVLTFDHQRRFGAPFQKARQLVRAGEIGDLLSVQAAVPNLYDYGTHSIDLCNMLAGDLPVKWVIAQIDYRKETLVFGAHCENQVLAQWEYANGVMGLAASGLGGKLIGCHNKAVGTEGEIEIGRHGEGMPVLRIKRAKGPKAHKWEAIDCRSEGIHGPGYIERAAKDMVESLQKGREPELSARKALNGTEIIFACYESSRRRARIDLPLTIQDNPLAAMVKSGELKPQPAG